MVTTTSRIDKGYDESMVLHICGVCVGEMPYGNVREMGAAHAKVKEVKAALARTLEEVGPELAALLAERTAP